MKRRNKTWRMAILIGNLLLPDRWVHNDKIGAKRLRRRLKLTEHFVKRIAGDDELRRLDYLTEFQSTMLNELMQVRAYLLNRLFLLGCSDAEVDGFKRVNDNLHHLHLEMYDRTRELWRRELSYPVKEEFDDDINIEGKIAFVYNDEETSIVKYDNDDWYGSDFPYMISLEYEIMDKGCCEEIVSCNSNRDSKSNPEMTDEQHGLELCLVDGTSSDNAIIWFCDNPKIKDIFIHFPMHVIVAHKNLPLADIVRMNDFWCDIRILHQKIIDQNGQHKSYIN